MSLGQVKQFAALFTGRNDAYGVDRGGVVKDKLTTRMYSDHLNGLTNAAIGVFPLRDDGTVCFAAVDLDEPNFALAHDIAQFVPAECWIERSRSGNAHIWVFFKDDCPAWAARGQLRQALKAVGREDVEIFPKQARLRPGMVGNYINLPYYGEDRPMVFRKGDAPDIQMEASGASHYTLEGFLYEAPETLADPAHWEDLCRRQGIEPPALTVSDNDTFGERKAPHGCAMYMIEHAHDNPLAPGHRHVVLFNLAKMFLNAQDYGPDETFQIVAAYNEAGEHPISEGEVRALVANAERGRWTSTGCDDPIMSPYVSPDCRIAHGG